MRINVMKAYAVVIASGLLANLAGAQPLTLAARGQPAAYTIVRPAKASPSQIYAAEELQKFTEQMTGAKLPIVADDAPLPKHAILLGNTLHTAALLGGPADLKDLGDDGFRLKTCPPHLLILGGPVRGTLYGVYETLERFGGCRWYASWHSVIPDCAAFTVPELDETQKPAFVMRDPFSFDMFNGDLAARNKVNGASPRLTEKHGGKIRFGKGSFVHTFKGLVPPAEFFDKHPEYFSEINGKRIKDNSQLCLTNPDVVKLVTARVLENIRQDPTAKLYSVSQNDCLNFCTCPNCKAIDTREGSNSGTMIAFVNQVAEGVEKEFPNVWIETLAYNRTRQPPKTIRPHRNVVVRLCSIECEFSKPLDRSTFGQNRKFVEEIRQWSAMTDKLYIWDYITNFRDYLGPFPNVLALQGNVKFFRDNHVVGVFEEGAYQGRHADFAELKAWLLARWLWNPELPAEDLFDDFFKGYYGAGAPLVRKYFDEIHAYYQNPGVNLGIYDNVVREGPVPHAFFASAVDLWRQAEASAKDSPSHSYNVRMGAIPALYAHMDRLPAHATEERRALATDLLARFREAKDIWISESAEIHKNTVAKWERLSQPPPMEVLADPDTHGETVEVTLRCNTEGAQIRYTVDGDEPNTESKLYDAPVAVRKGQKLRARAFKTGRSTSREVRFTPGELKICFQPETSKTLAGFLADTGKPYGDRGNGFTYGWSADCTKQTRQRVAGYGGTLCHFNKNQKWEIAIPNGRYEVTVGVGDVPYASDNTINVEGVEFCKHHRLNKGITEFTKTVVVADGRLTVDSGDSQDMQTKITHVTFVDAGQDAKPSSP